MEQSIQPDALWKALVLRGDDSSNAIAKYSEMPELKREAALKQIFEYAKKWVDILQPKEGKAGCDFREGKDSILTVIESLPHLVNTRSLRALATQGLKELDNHSSKLTNDDISARCSSAIDRLRVPGRAELLAALVVGGDVLSKAITDLKAMPLPGRTLVLTQAIKMILEKTDASIAYLSSNQQLCGQADFQREKQIVVSALEAIPSLTQGSENLVAAKKYIDRVEALSRELLDLALGVKCLTAKEKLQENLFRELSVPSLVVVIAIPNKPST